MSDTKGKEFAGPSTWKTLHALAAAYKPNPENAQAFKMYVYSLVYLFPCAICRVHLKQNLTNLPVENYLKSNDDLFFWTYTLHDIVNNSINKRLKKGEKRKISPDYYQIKTFYFKALGEECKDCQV